MCSQLLKNKKMKKIIFVACFMLNFFGYLYGQEYCENFKIVSILDIPPTPLTPGGNYFLLLLTVEETNLANTTIYTDLFFVDEIGDTISIPTGPSSTLPIYATDTIPYILKLNSPSNNQDFPENFCGKLIIVHPSNPVCEVNYSNKLTSATNIDDNNQIVIYPNPFLDKVKIKSEENIGKVLVINSIGKIVETYYPQLNLFEMSLAKLSSGAYFIVIQLVNGETLTRKLLKI